MQRAVLLSGKGVVVEIKVSISPSMFWSALIATGSTNMRSTLRQSEVFHKPFTNAGSDTTVGAPLALIVVIGSRRGAEEAYSTRVSVQTVPRSTGPLTLRRCVKVKVLPSILNSYTS